MAVFLDELQTMKMYKNDFCYPINTSSRFEGSMVYLMTPDIQSTIKLMNHKKTRLNKNLFKSYFLEKNIDLIIKNNSSPNKVKVQNEEYELGFDLNNTLYLNEETNVFDFDEYCLRMDDHRIYLAEDVEKYITEEFNVLTEDKYVTKFGSYDLSKTFRTILYNERIKSQKQIMEIYERIKHEVPYIKHTFVDPKLYKNKNLFYDWSFYTEIFYKNNKFEGERGLDIFQSFLNRFLSDNRFESYTKKIVVVPVDDWSKKGIDSLDVGEINPLSLFFRRLKNPRYHVYFKEWENIDFLFLGKEAYFRFNIKEYITKPDYARLSKFIIGMINQDYVDVAEITTDSKKVILNQLVDKLEKGGIEIKNLTGASGEYTKEDLEKSGLMDDPTVTDDTEVKKAILVNQLEKIAAKSDSVEDALEELDKNDDDKSKEIMKDILMDIQSDEGVKMNKARADRMTNTRKEFLKKEINGTSVKALMDKFETDNEIEEYEFPIDTIDDSWKHMKFPNFNKMYSKKDMDADIVAMFNHFTTVTHPMNILALNYENTSTSEDYINTWTCNYEDAESGKRFTMKLDMPILIGDRFMRLRGNEKVLLGQLMLLPVIKTEEDTVQMVSNYNKIFIRRKSPSGLSKTTPTVNKLCKALSKYNGKDMKIRPGDNRKICSRYELPIDFIDMACIYSTIEFTDRSYISFNMDILSKIPFDRSTLPDSDKKLKEEELNKKYMGVYVNSSGKRIPIINMGVDKAILQYIAEHDTSGKFMTLYQSVSVARKLMYSCASILSMEIPVIVLLSYNIGLSKVLDKANIKYELSDKRPSREKNYIVFSDGYLVYESKDESDDMLVNGIMQVETSQYSITEINSKDMWLGVLDDYGGRIKADGLDNFYDLMMDPITVEICKSIKIPSTYVEAMLYGNNLLVDNKYNRHSDITGNRLRINEVIVAHLYKVLSTAFGSYRNMVKRNKGNAGFSAKQSAVIDSLLTHDQTSSDLSTLTPLLEAESAGKVTFKGLSGMNSDRAFSIDKRTFDKSMLGVVGLSTGFASSVGINRQLTVDAGVRSKRGFITPRDPKDLTNVNTLSIMEALSPMALNHDDPFRTAMAFTQTAQHQMTVRKSMPLLVTSGADEALPYLTSNKFSYKFEGNRGTIIDMTDEYIVVQDDATKECQYIDIRETVRKNSDGGFFITTKLTPNTWIKKGAKVKKHDIIAYDKGNYSPAVGNGNNKNPNQISYNLGTIGKVAIMNTDLGFEDSCVVDSYASEALSSDICYQKEINLDKNSNVYNLVKPGDIVQADDPLLVFQDSFDEKEANDLLRMVSMDQEELSDIGRKHIRSKVAGTIQDIKIYRTCEIEQLSPTLQKIVTDYEKRINKLKNVMGKYKVDEQYTLEPTKKLPAEGKLKNLDGVRIEVFIKTEDIFSCGDKLVFYQALKGVCSYIIPKGKEAYTDFRKNEYVNSFLTINGVMARMVPSALTVGLLMKCMIELSRQCQEELGIKWRPLQDILVEK